MHVTFVNGREAVSAQCLSFVRAGEVRETMNRSSQLRTSARFTTR